jgi:hypothetical protein
MREELQIILSEGIFGNKVHPSKKSRPRFRLSKLLSFLKRKQKQKISMNIAGHTIDVYFVNEGLGNKVNLQKIKIILNRAYPKILKFTVADIYNDYKKHMVEPGQIALSVQDFTKNLTPEGLAIYTPTNGSLSFDAKDMLYGHWLSTEIDLRSGRPLYGSMNG